MSSFLHSKVTRDNSHKVLLFGYIHFVRNMKCPFNFSRVLKPGKLERAFRGRSLVFFNIRILKHIFSDNLTKPIA